MHLKQQMSAALHLRPALSSFSGDGGGELSPDFCLEDTVNGFTGVSDYE